MIIRILNSYILYAVNLIILQKAHKNVYNQKCFYFHKINLMKIIYVSYSDKRLTYYRNFIIKFKLSITYYGQLYKRLF